MRLRAISLCAIGVLVCSCASQQERGVPAWLADVEAVYPKEQFIALRGYGQDRQGAELAALAAISRYFSAHIDAETHQSVTVSERETRDRIDADTYVRTHGDLFAVKYVAPWFDKGAAQWVTVGFIDRDAAWRRFQPLLEEKDAAIYQCAARVDGNGQTLEAGTFYHPVVTVSVAGKNGAVFTWGTTLVKVGTSDPNMAKDRAFSALVKEIQSSLLKEKL